MKKKLLYQSLLKYLLGLMIISSLVFIPAGTLDYFNGWLLIGSLFIPVFILGIILFVFKPEMLEQRLKGKEKREDQQRIVKYIGLMFVLGFIVSGLNYRFGFYMVPPTLSILAVITFLIGYLLYGVVIKENVYLSRRIEVQHNQHVVDTGVYGVVRHPMYLATIILFLSIPLILGSLVSLLVFLCYPYLISKRIESEEALLLQELEGYEDYTRKVKYRLIPYIW